jgi:hypothetical protein
MQESGLYQSDSENFGDDHARPQPEMQKPQSSCILKDCILKKWLLTY